MIQSPAWWISAVVVGLIINLLSNLVWGRYLDKFLSQQSEGRWIKSAEEEEKYQKEVESLSKDPHGLIIEYIRAVVLFVSSLLVIVTMIAMLFLVPPTSNPAILISISILVVFSGGAFHRAIIRSTLLNAANRLRREALEKAKEAATSGPAMPTKEDEAAIPE
jgi:hypothetical protein